MLLQLLCSPITRLIQEERLARVKCAVACSGVADFYYASGLRALKGGGTQQNYDERQLTCKLKLPCSFLKESQQASHAVGDYSQDLVRMLRPTNMTQKVAAAVCSARLVKPRVLDQPWWIAAELRRMRRTASSAKSRVEYFPASEKRPWSENACLSKYDTLKPCPHFNQHPHIWPGNACRIPSPWKAKQMELFATQATAFQSTIEQPFPQRGLFWRWKS